MHTLFQAVIIAILQEFHLCSPHKQSNTILFTLFVPSSIAVCLWQYCDTVHLILLFFFSVSLIRTALCLLLHIYDTYIWFDITRDQQSITYQLCHKPFQGFVVIVMRCQGIGRNLREFANVECDLFNFEGNKFTLVYLFLFLSLVSF